MKLVVISDTHNKHSEFGPLPDGDVLIHCGDYSVFGKYEETKNFFDWFSSQKHTHKIVIPGNHEVAICPRLNKMYNREKDTTLAKEKIQEFKRVNELISSFISDNFHFLIDESVTIDNVKFYGTPWCGGERYVMGKWGFFQYNNIIRRQLFDNIPSDTDILISHSPPYGILDVYRQTNLGCNELLTRVKQIKPILHLFGHIHDAYGRMFSEYTEYYNCSNLDEEYKLSNEITVIDL